MSESNQIDLSSIAKAMVRFRTVMQESAGKEVFGASAAAHANQIVHSETGVDLLGFLVLSGALAVDEEPYFTPTEIGKRLSLSGKAINKTLEEMGYQESVDGEWRSLPSGKAFGGLRPSAKGPSRGEPDLRLRWKLSVIPEIKAFLSIKKAG